jgi:hypothetical protein
VRTGRDQRERRAGVGPADRLRQQPHSLAILQDLVGKGVQCRLGVSGVEFRDNHHTLSPFLFSALTPVLGPLFCSLLPSHLDQSSGSSGTIPP